MMLQLTPDIDCGKSRLGVGPGPPSSPWEPRDDYILPLFCPTPQAIFAKAEMRDAGPPGYCAWGCFADFEIS